MTAQNDEQDPADFHKLEAFTVVPRAEWGASEPGRSAPPLQHPAPHVHLSYVSVDAVAKTPEVLRDLQSDDIQSGMADVRANFMIAGDGSVYEGRGWNFQPDYIEEFADKMGKFIEICFLGEYDKAGTDHPIYIGMTRLLREGMYDDFIDKEATFLGMDDMPPLNQIITPPVYI